mmetsp:Transcript_40028/g.125777  ORF Transcript_40028/g.125777 Transcript_40028/m.125777 type:complete len:134 (-) Transcript_40028:376-777(-)
MILVRLSECNQFFLLPDKKTLYRLHYHQVSDEPSTYPHRERFFTSTHTSEAETDLSVVPQTLGAEKRALTLISAREPLSSSPPTCDAPAADVHSPLSEIREVELRTSSLQWHEVSPDEAWAGPGIRIYLTGKE